MVLERINLKKVKEEHVNSLTIKRINPSTLIRKERIDLIPKYLYVKDKDHEINSKYHKNLYLRHIKAFNNFNENDERGKIGKNKFIDDFESIIESIGTSGFDISKSLVPISKNGVILDGAHRVATSLYYNSDIHLIDTSSESPIYDISFFKNRGIPNEDIESILLNYSMIKDNVYVAILWGSASKKYDLIKNILNKPNNNLLYHKKINLTKRGMKNIIINCYNGQDWIGNISNKYSGYFPKMKNCFNGKPEIGIFVFEAENIKKVSETKKNIRDLIKIGKHSIHITDTTEESTYLLKTFLNKNSIHHLNFSDVKSFKKFHNLLSEFKKKINERELDKENVCVISSAVLSAYGIRGCRDLDYISVGKETTKINDDNIDNHNSDFEKHLIPELITNPNNYFYFNGIKFLNLNNTLQIKEKRGEGKDLRDINLTKIHFSNNGNFSWKVKKYINESKNNFYNNFYNIRIIIVRLIAKNMSEDIKKYIKKYIKI